MKYQKWNIAELMLSLKKYPKLSNSERITFEYVMLRGVNDSLEDAKRLVKLIKGIPSKINLIPFNRVRGTSFVCSPKSSIDRFREILLKGGLIATTRKTRGNDIDAACGQLAGVVKPRSLKRRLESSLVD